MNMNYWLFVFVQVFLAVAAIIAPLLQRKNLLFGVRLSKALTDKPKAGQFRRKFIFWGVLSMSLWIVMGNYFLLKLNRVSTYIIWGEIVIMFGLYIFFNKKVKLWKEKLYRDNPELRPKNPTKIIDTTFRNKKITISNYWSIIPGILVLGQLVFNYIFSNFLLNDPVLMRQTIALVIMNFILLASIIWKNSMIRNVKLNLDATAPKISEKQVLAFRRRWSVYLYLLLTFLIIMNIGLNLLYLLKIETIFDFILNRIYIYFFAIIFLVSALMVLLLGQSGSQLKKNHNQKQSDIDEVDDDVHWKGGLIYYNPEDPSLWVDKRMGIGWTLNFGNKRAWIFVAIVLSIIIFSAIMEL
ncbi:MAG: DUF5808 domain-containing protein [Fidelibacterota bacterium]